MLRTKSMTVAVLAGSLVMASLAMTTTAGASTPGVTANTITLGLITELTGPGASGTGMVRSAEARIDQQNAEGGVYGRKIKLIVRTTRRTRSRIKRPQALSSPRECSG